MIYVAFFFQIVDYGCSNCSFFRPVKDRLKYLREFVCVDMDSDELERSLHRVKPWAWDFLHRRRHSPLDVSVLCGSIAEFDPSGALDCVDAVTMIEVY